MQWSVRRILWCLPLLLNLQTFPCSQAAETQVGLNGDVEIDQDDPSSSNPTCHSWTGATCDWEPNLKKMTVTLGGTYNETFYAYMTPDVSTFYNETPGQRKAKTPLFTGQFGKFINMSPDRVKVHWHSERRGEKPMYISEIEPFGSAGTSTFPSHKFVVTDSSDRVLTEWKIVPNNALYYFDPFDGDSVKAQKKLSAEQYQFYYIQLLNRVFAHQYRKFTGYDWLAIYKYKQPPRYHMWRADSLGQVHTIVSNEIQYVALPPQQELDRGTSKYGPRPDEISRMRPYRDKYPTLELQLKVLSCAPRVFEIRNFLSDVEVDHIIQLAKNSNMQLSSTRAGSASEATSNQRTRTSKNTWINRYTDMITEVIHRRAADVLQINESLLRWRRKSEISEFPESMISNAERLQLVHYSVGQRESASLLRKMHHILFTYFMCSLDFSLMVSALCQNTRHTTIFPCPRSCTVNRAVLRQSSFT